jgi:hypothetical protein
MVDGGDVRALMPTATKTTTRCAGTGCTWSYIGTAAEGSARYVEHRRRAHMLRDPELEKLKDIVGHGVEVEIRLPREPVQWRREWIESLGGRIVIDPEAPMPLAMQRDYGNGHVEPEGLDALKAMDAGEPQPRERTEPMPDLIQCKIDGCHEEALVTRGRFAYLCQTHRDERVAEARAEGSLGSKLPRPLPEPEPEPAEEPAAELVPATPPPLPARPAADGDPESVDVFELFEHMASDERIAYYEELALRAQAKAQALRTIKEAIDEVRAVEA